MNVGPEHPLYRAHVAQKSEYRQLDVGGTQPLDEFQRIVRRHQEVHSAVKRPDLCARLAQIVHIEHFVVHAHASYVCTRTARHECCGEGVRSVGYQTVDGKSAHARSAQVHPLPIEFMPDEHFVDKLETCSDVPEFKLWTYRLDYRSAHTVLGYHAAVLVLGSRRIFAFPKPVKKEQDGAVIFLVVFGNPIFNIALKHICICNQQIPDHFF